MLSLDTIAVLISAVGAVIAAVVGLANQRTINNCTKTPLKLSRVINFPIGTNQHLIEIAHPDKPIDGCMVFYNGKPLVCNDNIEPRQLETFVFAGGVAQFRLPEKVIGALNEDALVVVKAGKKTLKSRKLKDVHVA